MTKIGICMPRDRYEQVFRAESRRWIREQFQVVYTAEAGGMNWGELSSVCEDVEVLLTGWGTRRMEDELVGDFKKLRLVANASGGVRSHLPMALWESGVEVLTASYALGWGVAEYALGMMLMASKRVFWLDREIRAGGWRESVDAFGRWFELYRTPIGIMGAGQSGGILAELLKPFGAKVKIYDPYVDDQRIARLGAVRVGSLEELVETCSVVSIHAALTEETAGIFDLEMLSKIQDGAVFINVSRGGLIEETALIEELSKERFIACLDVFMEEPFPVEHPFRSMRNVVLTPHVAGAVAENRYRMGDLIVEELQRYLNGEARKHRVEMMRVSAIA